MKNRKIAIERINILIQNIIGNAKSNKKLSQKYANLAKSICIKYRIKIPYEITMIFCKKCKCFILPGIGSRIRTGRSCTKSVRITCNFCGNIYRKIIPK